MKTLSYPILCYPHPSGGYVGVLLGEQLEAFGATRSSIKEQIEEHLKREYQKKGTYPSFPLEAAVLKTIETKVRIGYNTDRAPFLTTRQMKVPVHVVYGQSGDGTQLCFVPQLGFDFFCQDAKSISELVQSQASRYFRTLEIDEVNHLFVLPRPVLETVELKVKEVKRAFRDLSKYYRSSQTKFLERFAEKIEDTGKKNLSKPQAAWEMEDMVNKLADKILLDKANVLVVGESGTGKSTVLQAAAKKISSMGPTGSTPVLWQLVAQRIVAESKYLGEWQGWVQGLLDELSDSNGVLWITDIAQLLEIGSSSASESAAAVLKPYLDKNKVQVVGEATPRQLELMRRQMPDFVGRFQIIELSELSENAVFSIMLKFAAFAKQTGRVEIPRETIDTSFRLLKRFFPYERFPGKAMKFLGACLAEATAESAKKIGPSDALAVFMRQTGLPEIFLRDDLLLEETVLQQWFSARIIGQADAVAQLTDVVKIYKAGLNNPKRPIGVFVFAGPTGVGKTASALALADYFFGAGQKKSPLVRIDMSEFKHSSQLERLLGSGTQPGQLVKEIRERPFAVLLLDEIEKADPSIFDALLTLLDEGLLTDHFGRVTNFRNSIVVMTTNLGVAKRQAIGFEGGSSVNYETVLARHFRPEFVNRIDQIVGFLALDQPSIKNIARKELEALAQREGLAKHGIRVHFGEALVDHLAEVGFDPRYGARPLQRTVETLLAVPLAHWLLAHQPAPGTELYLDWDGEKLLNRVV